MRVFYPVSQVTELSAGYRYTTPRSAESAATGPSRGAAPVATPAWSSPHAANTAPPTIRGHPVPPCATAPAPLHAFVECFGPRPTPFSTPVCAQSSTKHSPKGLFRGGKCPCKMGYSVAAQRGIGHTCSQELRGRRTLYADAPPAVHLEEPCDDYRRHT